MSELQTLKMYLRLRSWSFLRNRILHSRIEVEGGKCRSFLRLCNSLFKGNDQKFCHIQMSFFTGWYLPSSLLRFSQHVLLQDSCYNHEQRYSWNICQRLTFGSWNIHFRNAEQMKYEYWLESMEVSFVYLGLKIGWL